MVRQVSVDACDALRSDLRQFLQARPDLTYEHFAQYTTSPASTIRLFMARQVNGGHQVFREIDTALKQAMAGDILTPGGANAVSMTENVAERVKNVAKRGNFYETQTVRRVAETLDYCAEYRAIGVITAGFGVGKTEAVRTWRHKNAGKIESAVFEFDEFSSTNKVDFVRLLARAYGIANDVGSQNGGLVFRDVCDYLRQHPCLLIFDQCETVRPRVCNVIRQLWDHSADAGVGVVMLAAPIFLQRLMKGMQDLGALTSRVGVWAPLTGLTRHEMAAILKQEGITEIDDSAFDLWFRGTAGSMRRLMRSLDLLKAKHAGKRVTEKTISGVASHLWGMNLE
jgi:DNA transposition AAA+ family ATPase